MEKKLRNLYTTIEVNALLWLVVCGMVITSNVRLEVKQFTVAGFIFAAVIQHRAYYNIFKTARQNQDKNSTSCQHKNDKNN